MPFDSSSGFYSEAEKLPRIIEEPSQDSSSSNLDDSLRRQSEPQETMVREWPKRKPQMPDRQSDTGFLETTRERFEIMKHWEAVVTAVEARSFFAMARSVASDNERAEDELEVDFENVLPSERGLVQEGAVFYLIVGTRYPIGGRAEKVTKLIFRRMPRWSAGDVKRARLTARNLWKSFNFTSEEGASLDAEDRKFQVDKK